MESKKCFLWDSEISFNFHSQQDLMKIQAWKFKHFHEICNHRACNYWGSICSFSSGRSRVRLRFRNEGSCQNTDNRGDGFLVISLRRNFRKCNCVPQWIVFLDQWNWHSVLDFEGDESTPTCQRDLLPHVRDSRVPSWTRFAITVLLLVSPPTHLRIWCENPGLLHFPTGPSVTVGGRCLLRGIFLTPPISLHACTYSMYFLLVKMRGISPLVCTSFCNF